MHHWTHLQYRYRNACIYFLPKNSVLVLSKSTFQMNLDTCWERPNHNIRRNIINIYNKCKHRTFHRHIGREGMQILSNCRTAFWIYFLISPHFFWEITKNIFIPSKCKWCSQIISETQVHVEVSPEKPWQGWGKHSNEETTWMLSLGSLLKIWWSDGAKTLPCKPPVNFFAFSITIQISSIE